MKRHVYRAVELKGIISKKRILKELGSEFAISFQITKKGLTHFIVIGRDNEDIIIADDYDPYEKEVITTEYDDLGTF